MAVTKPDDTKTTGYTVTASDWNIHGTAINHLLELLLEGTEIASVATASELLQLQYICDLTLSGDSADPFADVSTPSATLWLLPVTGNMISLYDTTGGQWIPRRVTGTVSLDVSALTVDQNYDVYGYWTGSAVALEALAWATHGAGSSARATSIVRQNGVYVKSGDASRRYLGTIRTQSSTGTKVQNDIAKRQVWNMYHRVYRKVKVIDTTDSWSYTTAAWQAINGNTANVCEMVIGVSEEPIVIDVFSWSTGGTGYPGIGIDVTNATSADLAAAATAKLGRAMYEGRLAVGFHQIYPLEYGGASVSFFGDAGNTFGGFQMGLVGEVAC